jgi:hypothetical protein
VAYNKIFFEIINVIASQSSLTCATSEFEDKNREEFYPTELVKLKGIHCK